MTVRDCDIARLNAYAQARRKSEHFRDKLNELDKAIRDSRELIGEDEKREESNVQS